MRIAPRADMIFDGMAASRRPPVVERRPDLSDLLTLGALAAAERVVVRVLREIPVRLAQAALFGSMARGEGRPDSDVDVLLVFEHLPPDREPHASAAEAIAEDVAAETGVPVTVWSVSLPDLRRGRRTPMLVDALADSVPIWIGADGPLPVLPFTPEDAIRCCSALLDRVDEGGEEFAAALERRAMPAALQRVRDDIVRMSTALLLLRGITRPRRGSAVRHALELEFGAVRPPHLDVVARWAIEAFGHDGRETAPPRTPPPLPPHALARAVDLLRERVMAGAESLTHRRLPPQPDSGANPTRWRSTGWPGRAPELRRTVPTRPVGELEPRSSCRLDPADDGLAGACRTTATSIIAPVNGQAV
jgi:hypothetical protein